MWPPIFSFYFSVPFSDFQHYLRFPVPQSLFTSYHHHPHPFTLLLMPSSQHSSPSPVRKPRRCQSRSSSHGRSRSMGDGDDRRKCCQSPSPPRTSNRTRGKRHRSCSHDDDCWGVHPELLYITHSHSSRCSVCMEYGAHLALASTVHATTYQRARYVLVHLQDRLLQRHSVEDVDRMLRHVEADNKELQSDNTHLQEENNELQARLVSMGPSQPHPTIGPSTNDAPSQAPSFSRGRAWEQRHPQRQPMGNLPTTHHDHTAQGTQPVYEDTSLTTSRPAPHKSAHKAFGTMELDEPRGSCPLHERFSNSEKMLDEIEGQLFPEFDGTECPRTICILREEWAEGKLKALFFRVNNKLYAYVNDAARQAYGILLNWLAQQI